MKRIVLVLTALMLVASFGPAQAQRGGAGGYGYLDHKFELHAFGGYAWTFSRSVSGYDRDGVWRSGDIDLKDNPYWGLSLDFVLQPGPQVGQLTLLFRTQPTTVTLKERGITEDITDVDVNYYHIGGLGGILRGKAMPFTMLTLGATQYRFKETGLDDEWRFSIMFGLGAKIYASEKLGLKIQGTLPFTFFNSWFGGYCGTGGCGMGLSGSGLTQIDVGGGLFLAF